MVLLKFAEKEVNKKIKKNLSIYVGILRGLYIIHQHAHLVSAGKESYSDHLLFQRLYESIEEHIDQSFEKFIGNFGKEIADLQSHIQNTYNFVNYINNMDEDLVVRSLVAEELFLKQCNYLYKLLEKEEILSFGIDDMIMAIAGEHEDFVYLLKQRIEPED